jgi:hypothetical protein
LTTYVIGDLHGHLEPYQRLLQQQGLCDEQLNWSGGAHQLWLIGDFFDRGASGIGCLELTMKLQQQAPDHGGLVNALLGNHELMLLCARRFQDQQFNGVPVVDIWRRWGGIDEDLSQLDDTHEAFIRSLPAMALVNDQLLIHADAMLYVNHGITIDMVNQGFRRLLDEPDVDRWMVTLEAFSEHEAFSSLEMTGAQRAGQLLKLYGGQRLIHGHTPIPYARGDDPTAVVSAWEYANGLCVNVDGGIYMGSPGFVYSLND